MPPEEKISRYPDSEKDTRADNAKGGEAVDKRRRSLLYVLVGGIVLGAAGCAVIPGVKNGGDAANEKTDGSYAVSGEGQSYSEAAEAAKKELARQGYKDTGINPVPTQLPSGGWRVVRRGIKNTAAPTRTAEEFLNTGPQADGSYIALGEGENYREAVDAAKKELAQRGYTVDTDTLSVITQPPDKWSVTVRGRKNTVVQTIIPEKQPEITIKERHIRLIHPQYGPVHVWCPEHNEKDKLDVVVYVHGYNSTKTVDDYWEHVNNLQDQFKASGRKAIFIAPQAQHNSNDAIRWKNDLRALVDYAVKNTNTKITDNITVIAHSGGYVTAESWIDEKNLNTVVLLDGFWNNAKRMAEWAGRQGKKLILVSTKNTGSTERHIRLLDNFRRFISFMGVPNQFSEKDSESSIVHIRSGVRHKDMPSKKSEIIQRLLRLFRGNKNSNLSLEIPQI